MIIVHHDSCISCVMCFEKVTPHNVYTHFFTLILNRSGDSRYLEESKDLFLIYRNPLNPFM